MPNRSLFSATILLGLFVVLLLVCPGRRHRNKIPWQIRPEAVVTTVGARIPFVAYQIDPRMAKDGTFRWTLEAGEGPLGSLSDKGVLIAPSQAARFTVVAINRKDGTVLRVPVQVMATPVGQSDELAAMPYPLISPMLVALTDGSVLALGEDVADHGLLVNPSFAPAQRFDPARNLWRVEGALQQPRFGHGLLVLRNGGVLVAGGLDGARTPVRQLELMDLQSGQFQGVGTSYYGYQKPALVVLPSGDLLLCGADPASDPVPGRGEGGQPVAERLHWQSGNSQFQAVPLVAPPAAYHQGFRLASGRIFLVGFKASALFDPVHERFSELSLGGASRVLDCGNGHFRLVRGAHGDMHTRVLEVDPEAGRVLKTWEILAAEGAGPALLGNGHMLWLGGSLAGRDRADALLFDPGSGLRAELPPMRVGRRSPGIVVLVDGSVLALGGMVNDLEPSAAGERFRVSF